MSIADVVQWVVANSKDLLMIVTSIIGIASIIVKLTPTPKDDEVFGKIYAFISKYIALNK